MTDLQYRWFRYGQWTNWFNLPIAKLAQSLFINNATEIQFRDKPAFEPSYYRSLDALNVVRWFEQPPNDPIWQRVNVIPTDD